MNSASPGPAPACPGPGQQLAAHPVQLADVAPPKAAQEGPEGGGRLDHAAENTGRPTGTQRIGIVDAVTARQRGRDQRQQLVPCVGPPRRAAEVEVTVDEFPQAQVPGEGGRQEQAGIGHQAVVIKDDADPVGIVLWQHLDTMNCDISAPTPTRQWRPIGPLLKTIGTAPVFCGMSLPAWPPLPSIRSKCAQSELPAASWSTAVIGTTTWGAAWSFQSAFTDPGSDVEVTVAVGGVGAFGEVVEILPDRFSYLSSSLPETSVRVTGREVSFTLLGVDTFPYMVTAATVEGSHHFDGWILYGDYHVKPVYGRSILMVSNAPRVSVTVSTETRVRPNSPIPVAVTFSEPVFGFTIDGIIAANGSVSNFTGSGAVYTFDVTPDAIGEVAVDIFDSTAGGAPHGDTSQGRQAGYPSPKAVGAISSRSQVQIRRMLLEGNPVIVAMRLHERPSRWRMFCISSARFRLTPLRRPRCLPVAFTRSSPASVRSRARSRSISANTMARCSIARPMALS